MVGNVFCRIDNFRYFKIYFKLLSTYKICRWYFLCDNLDIISYGIIFECKIDWTS